MKSGESVLPATAVPSGRQLMMHGDAKILLGRTVPGKKLRLDLTA